MKLIHPGISYATHKRRVDGRHINVYLAITSTYLPFFFPLTVLPLRACGAPIRSSIELALPRDDLGRDGGGVSPVPDTVFIGASLEADRGAGRAGGSPSEDCPLVGIGRASAEVDGRPSELAAFGGGPIGGSLAALATLDGGAEAFGGGGVARTGVPPSGSFLLTHFFRSLS